MEKTCNKRVDPSESLLDRGFAKKTLKNHYLRLIKIAYAEGKTLRVTYGDKTCILYVYKRTKKDKEYYLLRELTEITGTRLDKLKFDKIEII